MTDKLSEHISLQEANMAEVLQKIVNDKELWVAERNPISHSKAFRKILNPRFRRLLCGIGAKQDCLYNRMQKSITFQRPYPGAL